MQGLFGPSGQGSFAAFYVVRVVENNLPALEARRSTEQPYPGAAGKQVDKREQNNQSTGISDQV
jgi:hypothetical protein